MRTLISWLRFIKVLLWMFFVVVASYIYYPLVTMALWRKSVHRPWAHGVLNSIGSEVRITRSKLMTDEFIQPNTMFVQNHVSWLDTIVMNSIYCTNYVGKIEMLQWGLLKNIIKSGGTVFIDRKNKRELVLANRKIAEVLQSGWAMGLFPEGTTSDGTTVLPFHASIFEAAILAKSKIVPVVTRYRNEDDSLCREVTFSNKGWMESVWSTFRMKKIIIKVDILDPIYAADFENREAISNHLFKKVSEVYHSDLK